MNLMMFSMRKVADVMKEDSVWMNRDAEIGVVGDGWRDEGGRRYLWAGGGAAVDAKAAAFSVDIWHQKKRQISVRFF